MPLTIEQMDSEIIRAAALANEATELDQAADKTFKIMFVFLILGIFFFPCLVVALICFALYYFGKNKAKENMAEVHRIESVPEILERIVALTPKQ